jgi:prepilin-type processing-associated H-X9-DG protein
MKVTHQKCRGTGFTLKELLVIVAVTAVLMGLSFATAAKAKARKQRIACTNNLKQTGLSFRMFANDNDGKFPKEVSTNEGGSKEYLSMPDAFPHWRALSNELSTPKVLICPADNRMPAASFAALSNANISYFVGLDALETFPQMVLAGDRNLMTNGIPVGSGLLILTTNVTVGWTAAMHNGAANVVLGDGSVQQATSARLSQQIGSSDTGTNHLLIP